MTDAAGRRTTVRLIRTFDAAPGRVYRAWLDPDIVRRWKAPASQEVVRVEIDELVGGAHQTWKAEGGVIVGGFDSELLELVPDQRLVFRWGLIGPQRREGPSFDTRLTVTCRAFPSGGTELTLVHEHLDELAEAMPHIADNVGPGWDAVLRKFDAVLKAGAR